MQHPSTRIIVLDGVVAGLIGAGVIAIWFLALDAARGQPLATPTLLAASLLPGLQHAVASGSISLWLVLEYSAFHFCAFAAIGAAGALLLEAADREPSLFASLVIFVIAFEVFFVAVVMMLGPSAAAALPWWKVIIGNALATVAMLGYFFWRQPALGRNLLGAWVDVAADGMVAGVIGAVILAAWFLIYDAAALDMFHTPSLLGSVIFGGAGASAVSFPMVIVYTVLHFCGFIAFGVAASILVYGAEREPLLALGVVVLFVWFEVSFFGFITFLDQSAVEQLGWWKIIIGNLLALAGMISYFEHGHPQIVPQIAKRWEEIRSEGRTPRPRPHPL